MKKIFLILVVLCTTIVGFSQVQLFRGINSGITPEEFRIAWESDSAILYKTEIEDGKEVKEPLIYLGNYVYIIEPHYTEDNKLKLLLFYGTKKYTKDNYASELRVQGIEIYDILALLYNQPTYDDWKEWYEIPLNKRELLVEYNTDSHGAGILVSNNNTIFHIYFIIGDKKLLNK